MKKIITSALVVVVATLVISAGFALAVTFKDVTPIKTEKVEKVDAKGLVSIVEQAVEVPDLNKKIEKSWTEAMTSTFNIDDKVRSINDQFSSIGISLKNANSDVDDIIAIVSELSLDLGDKMPVKKVLSNK